jgi:hypothetical protein
MMMIFLELVSSTRKSHSINTSQTLEIQKTVQFNRFAYSVDPSDVMLVLLESVSKELKIGLRSISALCLGLILYSVQPFVDYSHLRFIINLLNVNFVVELL